MLRVRLCVSGRAQPAGRRADLRVRVPLRLGRAGLHGVARAGLLHLRDRPVRRTSSGATRKSAAPPPIGRTRWRTRWLLAPRSDIVAAVLLGIATFSKPTNILLIVPLLVSAALRRQWLRARQIVGGVRRRGRRRCSRWNIAHHRRVELPGRRAQDVLQLPVGRHVRIGGFPFQNEASTFDTVGIERAISGGSFEVLFTRDALLEVFPHNLGYFFFGRHTGFCRLLLPGRDGDPAVPRGDARSRDVAMADARRRPRSPRWCCCSTCRSPTPAAAGRSAIATSSASTPCSCSWCRRCRRRSRGLLAMAVERAVHGAARSRIRSTRRCNPAEHTKTGLFRWLPPS